MIAFSSSNCAKLKMASDAAEKSQQPAHLKSSKKKFSTYVYAAAWIVSFYFLWDFLHLKRVLLSLEMGVAYSTSILTSLGFGLCFLYLSVYLPFKGIKIDYANWEIDAPKTIQLASALMVISFISWCATLWSHFHMATPLILFTSVVSLLFNL